MPRFRVPNASLIASADLSILPFLAPRVFAESAIPRRSRQHRRRSDATPEKEKGTAKHVEGGTRVQPRDGKPETRKATGTTCRKQPMHDASATGFLQTSGYWMRGTGHSASVNRLYAEISTFTRQHARSYATIASNNQSIPKKVKSSRRLERTKAIPEKAKSSRRQEREKALSVEYARLDYYMSTLPSQIEGSSFDRKTQGQYRSLTRRITNLKRWGLTHLDLTRAAEGSAKEVGLHYAFAALDRPLYPSLRKFTRRVTIKHDPRCARLSWTLFTAGTHGVSPSTHQVWLKWLALDISIRKAYAHRVLIYLLDRKPCRALHFVKVLANDPLQRGRKTGVIADALDHLAQLHTQGLHDNKSWGADPEAHKRRFVSAFVHLFEKSLAGQIGVCSQNLLYNLVELATTKDLKKVFDCLVQHRVGLEFDTVLHYATAFGKAGEVQYALKCLDLLTARSTATPLEVMVDRKRLRWTCAGILRRSMSESKDFHQTPLVVAAIVRLGIKMDILLYNIVMHNAMEAGDYATAFKVYNSLEENGLREDNHTLSIMLHGCTMQNDPALFQAFAQHCADIAGDTRDPWLATDYIYYLYVRHHGDENVERTSAILWQSYARYFSVALLQSFVGYGTPDLRNVSISQKTSALGSLYLAPPPVALYIMLRTEIRSALAISNTRVYNLYIKFKSVVEEGNPEFDALAQNPIIWNAFLLAFCEKQQFANASQLIQDMTDGPAKPNVYSWNIFMQAFFKTRQVQAAERVSQLMRNSGVEPDRYTWGVLLRGYARAQLVDRIGDIIPHLKPEEELDDDLLRHLAKVVDRRKLMDVLEENRSHKETIALEKAAQEAEDERSRWRDELTDGEAATITSGLSPVQLDMIAAAQTKELPATQPGSSVVPPKLTSVPEQPTESPSMHRRPSRLPRANLRDPEVQYRKLQEQLGLVESTESAVNDRVEPESVEPSSAGLAFKSIISKNSVRAINSGKPATTRKRVRFNLVKPGRRG
ncbi:unnamed protein product [Alternaria alternata]|jgi:pentatricopeptide repeat protein|uniref:Pentacotripeptide-repeat region of PRORP domain-containing protein n=1 Tax=Alternaria alternata TaxID=5599 RepID=A0A4Q4N5R4_ALTAL|nr:hypothetical protein AALT_g2788 [Alternaria alternata]RYN70429.1 hypothetical protein AA0117_g10518 [Alternaria alternata]